MQKLNELMAKDKETIIMGDLNFNADAINKIENEKTKYEQTFNKMYSTIKNLIFSKSSIQLINKNTRKNSILDHVYTNNPKKNI